MVGLFRKGLAQIILIELLHRRIFVREAQGSALVQGVELCAPAFRQLLTVVYRLSAAAGAAAGAGHHFHKIILNLAPPQGFDQSPGVPQAMGHSYPQNGSLNLEGGFFPAVHAAHVPEGVGGWVLACR